MKTWEMYILRHTDFWKQCDAAKNTLDWAIYIVIDISLRGKSTHRDKQLKLFTKSCYVELSTKQLVKV